MNESDLLKSLRAISNLIALVEFVQKICLRIYKLLCSVGTYTYLL